MTEAATLPEEEPGKINPEAAAIADSPPLGEPGPTTGADQAEPEKNEDLAIESRMAVDVLETLVQSRWPYIEYAEATKQSLAGKFEPVLRKYDVMPPWLKHWQEEIALGVVLASTAYSTYMMIQYYEAEHGEEPTDQTSQPEHAVHSEVGGGEESSVDAESGDSKDSGPRDFMG